MMKNYSTFLGPAVGLIGSLALISSAQAAATLTALWQFEETGGATATDSAASIPGAVIDADLNVAGRFGSGIDFSTDGTQSARVVTNTVGGHAATQLTGDFTVLVWIQPTAADITNTFNRFIDTSSNNGGITTGYRLMSASAADTDNFRFLGDSGASNTSVIHPRNFLADAWTLLAVRYDTDGQASLNVLLDGDTVDAAFVAGNIQSGAANGPIVYAAGENTNFGTPDTPTLNDNDFDGIMDDAAFFSGLLTDEEIATVFNSGAGALIPEPSSVLLLVSGLLGFGLRRRRN